MLVLVIYLGTSTVFSKDRFRLGIVLFFRFTMVKLVDLVGFGYQMKQARIVSSSG